MVPDLVPEALRGRVPGPAARGDIRIAQILDPLPLEVEEVLGTEITVFKDRIRLDVQTFTPGLIFVSAWERRVTMKYKDQPFFVVAREDLIASKRASGREVDLEDVRILELAGSKTSAEE